MIKIACLSDTHTQLERVQIPPCDLILHAGDFSYRGEMPEIKAELKILANKAKYAGARATVITPGNHDWAFVWHEQDFKDECRKLGLTLLIHEPFEFEGFKIFGSPYTPEFFDWAYNVPRGPKLAAKWAQIPDDTNILITHGPPHMILDRIPDRYVRAGSINPSAHVGCEDLGRRLSELSNLKLHVWGHIHHSYGQVTVDNVQYVNASCCNEAYKPKNPVIVVEV